MSNTSTPTMGFTNKYFTLWMVSEPYEQYIDKHLYVMRIDYTYRQNLSFNEKSATAKMVDRFGDDYNVDLELRSTQSFYRDSSIKNNYPEDVFSFGMFSGVKFSECDDVWQLNRARSSEESDVRKQHALNRLIELNEVVKCGNEYLTQKEYEKVIIKDKIKSLNSGHLYVDGKRIELLVKEIESFSFEGAYGSCNVITYETDDGNLVKYVGGGYPDTLGTEFTKIKATIKHSDYNGTSETKLQRIFNVK
jgi:hypothetical protein